MKKVEEAKLELGRQFGGIVCSKKMLSCSMKASVGWRNEQIWNKLRGFSNFLDIEACERDGPWGKVSIWNFSKGRSSHDLIVLWYNLTSYLVECIRQISCLSIFVRWLCLHSITDSVLPLQWNVETYHHTNPFPFLPLCCSCFVHSIYIHWKPH